MIFFSLISVQIADIEQTITWMNLIYLEYFLPKELKNLSPEFSDALYDAYNLSLDI